MKKLTTEEIINRAKIIHGDNYGLSKINYINYDTKITIICPEHGEFEIRPDHFLEGNGCPKCGHERGRKKASLTQEQFIIKAKQIHGDKYDYSKVEYKNARTKVCIICPIHGEFWQIPYSHMRGDECPQCAHRSYKYTTKEFIEKARQIHGDKYDYSKVEYVNNKIPVCIICPEHGEFWQTPLHHMHRKNGCPMCHESHLEREIKILLKEYNINYIQQKAFGWLRYTYPMKLDFYLPDYNIAIECQGEQHFKKREFFKNYGFEKRLEMDLLKNKLCKDNRLPLLYFSKKYLVPKNWDKYNVICNKNKLIDIIKNGE